ncbi:MAG: preprotein translocase subunit SecG [Hyphomicrobium sp.]
MHTALLVLHLMVASTLVAVVLLQRSEGGALGIGGGGGGAGGLLTGRGTANLLTRATALLALAFFTTSILLTLMAQRAAPNASILDAGGTASPSAPVTPGSKPAEAASGRGGILDKLQQGQGGGPAVPQSR